MFVKANINNIIISQNFEIMSMIYWIRGIISSNS